MTVFRHFDVSAVCDYASASPVDSWPESVVDTSETCLLNPA